MCPALILERRSSCESLFSTLKDKRHTIKDHMKEKHHSMKRKHKKKTADAKRKLASIFPHHHKHSKDAAAATDSDSSPPEGEATHGTLGSSSSSSEENSPVSTFDEAAPLPRVASDELDLQRSERKVDDEQTRGALAAL